MDLSSPQYLTKLIQDLPADDPRRDWSVDLLQHIALAIDAADRLKQEGVDIAPTVSWLERAWRQAKQLRGQLPRTYIADDLPTRRVVLNRQGRVIRIVEPTNEHPT